MDTLRNLQEIYNSVANKFNQYRGEDFVLPQVFKDQVKEINSNVISYNKYSAVIETRGNQNGVLNIYLPNQWFYIASYFTDFYRELLKYKRCALKVASKERLKDLNGAILTDSEQNAVKELDIDEQSQEYLIKFITDYSWWYGAKTIDRGDFFVSPILNSAKLVNASQSFVADLCAFLADKEDLVKVIMSGYTPSETLIKKELVRQKAAATFMKKAMQLTLEKDLDLNRLAALNKYEKTSKQLKINGFFLGRNKNQPPTRIDDIYEDVSWMYDSVNYVLYLEWTPDMMEKRFFPVYNEAYNGMLKMEKDSNGEYVLYEYVVSLSGNTFEKGPLQQIFYGAPGTGKSHTIKEQTKGDDTVIRTTFHPDSDYSTFVGCYKPTMSEKPKPIYGFDATGKTAKVDEERKIEYKFIQQAFTKAYIQAWKKMCDTSLWAKTATAMPPIGKASTPYTRTSKIGDYEDFDCTFDKATLTDSEKAALLEVDNFDFPFDGINNFGKLHDMIKKVVVTDKPTPKQNERYPKEITLTAEQIRFFYSRYLERETSHDPNMDLIMFFIRAAALKLGIEIKQLENYDGDDVTIPINNNWIPELLGLYDPQIKTVFLFKDNIGDDKNLLCAVYIHEMFHAYYDNSNNSGNKYIPEIEEPIVECNTLCFLELFDNGMLKDYLAHVAGKRFSPIINYYGFGAHLYENRSLDWMKLYQSAYIHIDTTSAIVKEYKDKFNPIYPFGNEDYTRNLLYAILNPLYDEISIPKLARQFLIIEEINRGNCAQIFGDLFQLLDRVDDGYSEYPIEADFDLRKELEKEFKHVNFDAIKQEIDDIFKENYRGGITEKIKSGELLVLPRNLFIWATMNTSDQSLFPIDSAFKRRWEWKYQPIIKGVDEKTGKELDWKIKIDGYQPVDWWEFIERINNVIFNLTSSEDKQLGYFFCKPESKEKTTISAKRFVEKVIFYLWNDVFKDYSYDPECCNKKDKKEEKVQYSDFYTFDGKDIDTEVIANFINQLKTKDGKESPLAIKE